MSGATQGFHLSPQQKRLWLLQEDEGLSHAQCAMMIEGPLNTAALIAGLENIVARHSILRTRFPRMSGVKVPLQVVDEAGTVDWREHDVAARPALESLEAQLRADRAQPFDLEHGWRLRATLLTLAPDRHRLIVSLPVLCADPPTLANLAREIEQQYAVQLGQAEPPESAVQYLQFSEWQNQLLEQEDEDSAAGRAFWAAVRVPSATKLPIEYKQPRSRAFDPAMFTFTIDVELLTQLRALAADCEADEAIVLYAAWRTLLWRLDPEAELALAYAYAAREHEELQHSFGLFMKWLPLVDQLDQHSQFTNLITQVASTLDDAINWQEFFIWDGETTTDAPFPAVGFEFVEQIQPSQTARFSVEQQIAHFDKFKLKLICIEDQDQLRLEIHYDANLFPAQAPASLADQLQTLLLSIVQQPDALISEFNILTARAQHQLLTELNATALDFGASSTVHQLFQEQVTQLPSATAVVFEDQQLTYAELDRYTNQVAHHLRSQQVGPETVVGLCLDRSLEMISGLLGILKAGAAYLPLDPTLPPQRLQFMLAETGATVVVTREELTARLPEQGLSLICLDRDRAAIAQQPTTSLTIDIQPENLAYVLFTSGSTGRPKGVAVEHRQLYNYVQSALSQLGLASGGNFALVSTIAADLGNTMLFPALCSGGALHLIAQDRLGDLDGLATYFEQHTIDHLKITPSHLRTLMMAGQPQQIVPRQRLVIGGEATPWDLVIQCQQWRPACRIFNHYGPTETTVGALIGEFNADSTDHLSVTFTLSRALPNLQVYILDDQLQPVPLNVPGQLYIGGAGVSRGYFNQPQLTADRFIPNPFATDTAPATSRLYRTGDLARHLVDGTIEYLGRTDDQVKIRGFRIELGEIEAALRQHPAVRTCVVVASEANDDRTSLEQRLIAYIVSTQTNAPATSELRRHLLEQMPEYMVPSAFVILDALPLTANGKVDRRALPLPEAQQRNEQVVFVAPRTPIEQQIADVWSSVLHIERVGVKDNFFDLGGHSLLATQVMARLRNLFHMDLPVRTLFETPTIAGLAELMVQQQIDLNVIDNPDLSTLLDEVEQLSPDQAQSLLKQVTHPLEDVINE